MKKLSRLELAIFLIPLVLIAIVFTAVVTYLYFSDSETEVEAVSENYSTDHLGKASNAPVHYNIDEWENFANQYDDVTLLIREFNDDVQAVCLNAFDVQFRRDLSGFEIVEFTALVSFPYERYEDEWRIDLITAAIIDSWCPENYEGGDLGKDFGVRQ